MKTSDVLSVIAIFALILTSFATILTMQQINDLSEKETHPNLIVSNVEYNLFPRNSSNGLYDLLLIRSSITLYNTKRSDYPARILSVKNEIMDYSTEKLIHENKGKFSSKDRNDKIIDTGEKFEFETEIEMELNTTGKYKTQTTIEYVDLKDNSLKSLYFYNVFEIEEELFENQFIIYTASLKPVGDFNEFWAIGNNKTQPPTQTPSYLMDNMLRSP